MEKTQKHIVVLGAGIMGLSVAHKLLRLYGSPYRVTVVAEFFSPSTLSDKSVGLWGPFLPGGEDSQTNRVLKWGLETKKDLETLQRYSPTNEWCIFTANVWVLSESKLFPREECHFKEILDDLIIQDNVVADNHNSSLSYTCPMLIPTHFLKRLTTEVKNLGVTFVTKRIENISEFYRSFDDKIDFFVNCLGLGAKHVVNDESLNPVRGILVKLPPVPKYMMQVYESFQSEITYIMFRPDCTLCGGSAYWGDWTKQNKKDDVEKVLNRCRKVFPELEKYEPISDWSGLRPGRPTIRLEIDYSLAPVPVIHNYGHGGAGWSLYSGCATEVVEIICKYFVKSKL